MNAGEPRVVHRYADLGGVRLHYVEAGEGPLVVLLHGFPEFWYSWRFQIPALAEAGFRVVAPDMRGYNLSGKPEKVSDYRVELLVQDVSDLIHHLGKRRACLVGHDWGGAVAWTAAMLLPELVEKLVVLNLPHPKTFMRGLLRPKQLRKSWYIFALQTPGAPGRYVQRKIFEWMLLNFRRDPVRVGTFGERDLELYREAMSRPGALTAATNYYRALLRRNPKKSASLVRRIEAPTLLIWGERDRYLGVELLQVDRDLVPHLQTERLPDASHWVQQDAPQRVNRLLRDFLKSPKPGRQQC
ncbi:alpha/beta fold hydrolase [Rubrobacter indicoceani]|uniref:alpha/beta fold hydrolase n=1 Tax=Rubrobacter indicoceani TaxID=2051957 RepID=UPI000E5AB940|nr:alpha/beta hydrolase [Rubrobacter indicoceani]